MSSSTFLLLAVFAGLLATSGGLLSLVWVRFSAPAESQRTQRSSRFFMASLLAVAGLSLAFYALPQYQITAAEEGNFRAVLSALYASQKADSEQSGGLLIWHKTTANFRTELDFDGLHTRIPSLEAATFEDFMSRNLAPAGTVQDGDASAHFYVFVSTRMTRAAPWFTGVLVVPERILM